MILVASIESPIKSVNQLHAGFTGHDPHIRSWRYNQVIVATTTTTATSLQNVNCYIPPRYGQQRLAGFVPQLTALGHLLAIITTRS